MMQLTKNKIFVLSLICFIVGIAGRSWIEFDFNWLIIYIFILTSVTTIFLFYKNKTVLAIGLSILFLFLGIARYQLSLPKIDKQNLAFYNNQEVVLEGIVCQESDIRQSNAKINLQVEKILIDENWQEVKGKVLITTFLYPEYNYGDRLEIKGKLQPPEQIEDFKYDRYLARFNIYSLMYYPRIKVIQANQGNKIYAGILNFKNKFKKVIDLSLPGEQAGIFGAMTLGSRRGVSENLVQNFSLTGTSHVMAISGLHITIIVTILMGLLIGLGLKRSQAFYGVIIILFLYVVMIGFPASAMRASLMGLMVLWAMKEGRLNQSTNALLIVACVLLLINPKLLRDDLGFKLSFGAVLGIILVAPLLEKVFHKLPETLGLKSSITMTLSAQVFTLPLIVLSFGNLSVISPIANVLILPVVPLIMMLGLGASLIGLISLKIAQILFWPVWLLLTYIIKIVTWFGELNFSSLKIERLSDGLVIVLYLVLIWVIWEFKRAKNKCRG
ncbi:MAG: ComEC/Rec2 family competence protein [Patescibacteria group bacterium]|nr:ComEC/Rec2 family competence protein [Patescibacteria group bacterium]